jgi:hypothetical protein
MKNLSSHSVAIAFLFALPLYSLWNGVPESRAIRYGEINRPNVTSPFFQVGEELTYEARWWFIKLGTIRTRVVSEYSENNSRRYNCTAYIDSYSGIPFVNLHAIFHTSMDGECYSYSFTQREKEENNWEILLYKYDRTNNVIFVEKGTADSDTSDVMMIEKIDTVAVDTRTQDGLSLLYFARANVKSQIPFTVPTMIRENQGATVLNFPGKRTSVEIDAVNYPVDVIEFDGDAKFNGIFGFNGPFTGWFSNDTAQIPINAKTSVIIGSITIELIRWSRPGWEPPKALN